MGMNSEDAKTRRRKKRGQHRTWRPLMISSLCLEKNKQPSDVLLLSVLAVL
jgi:hypothetical protein